MDEFASKLAETGDKLDSLGCAVDDIGSRVDSLELNAKKDKTNTDFQVQCMVQFLCTGECRRS